MLCPKCSKARMERNGYIMRCPKCGHKDYIDAERKGGKEQKIHNFGVIGDMVTVT